MANIALLGFQEPSLFLGPGYANGNLLLSTPAGFPIPWKALNLPKPLHTVPSLNSPQLPHWTGMINYFPLESRFIQKCTIVVLLSSGCRNKVPHTAWFITTKFKMLAGPTSLQSCQERVLLCVFQLLGVLGIRWFVAVVSLCSRLHMTFSLWSVFQFPSSSNVTSHNGLRAHPTPV